jgi:hypothetical protein
MKYYELCDDKKAMEWTTFEKLLWLETNGHISQVPNHRRYGSLFQRTAVQKDGFNPKTQQSVIVTRNEYQLLEVAENIGRLLEIFTDHSDFRLTRTETPNYGHHEPNTISLGYLSDKDKVDK